MQPNPITHLWQEREQSETEIRDWFFMQMPLELRAYNKPQIHFAYLNDLHDASTYEPQVGAALLALAEKTTDQNFMNHIRTFEYALDNGLGKVAYSQAYALTYRLGIIAVDKNDPEINLRVLAFLNKLDVHSSDQ